MSGTPPNSIDGDAPSPKPTPTVTPPALLQLAPKSVRLLHKNEPLPMRKGRYSILTGKPFTVIVEPQSPDDRVEIKFLGPIQDISPLSKKPSQDGSFYQIELIPKLARQAVPHTVMAKVWVTITRSSGESRQLKFSIRVRPTILLYMVCILLAFFGLSAQRLSKVLTDSDSIQASLQKIVDDMPTLGSLFAVSTLVVIPVKILGFFLTRSTDTGEDD